MQPTACQDVNSVFQHTSFNPGQSPAAIVPKKKCTFQTDDSLFKQVKQALTKQPEFCFQWMVEVKSTKVVPVGLALVVIVILYYRFLGSNACSMNHFFDKYI